MSSLSISLERPGAPRVCRILIADDHTIVRTALRCLLEATASIQVVAEAGDGEEALARIAEHQPDVALVDVTMPKLDGIEVTRRLAEAGRRTRVIALTAHEDGHLVRDALAAGAAGFVAKGAAASELVAAIQVVAAGGHYVDASAVTATIETLLDRGRGKSSELSARESEVLRLLALGHTTKDLAARLTVSIKSVETYKARGMEKAGISTRVELVQFAIASGWFVARSGPSGGNSSA